jgi:Protein of unknown function (DUF2809)
LKRKFVIQLVALAGVILLGLLSRKYSGIFPVEIQKYPGSALWGLAVFVFVGLLLQTQTTLKVAGVALVISFAIEFSQLLNVPWLNEIRATKVGHLFLGSTFNTPDLLAYALGILAGVGCEVVLFNSNR